LALHAASRFGARVKSYNVSREQVAYARARARGAGLDGRVEFIEDDYRNATGRCDAFLSVGMLEHVGPAHYPELGQLAKRLLRPEGFGLIHTIGRVAPEAVDPWIRKRVFPGTYVPSLAELMAVFEPNGLAVTDVENLRPHYARTLALWLGNFERQRQELGKRLDESFLRLWQLYLASSCAAFAVGRMQLYQVAFTSPANRRAPWTREALYQPDARTWEWTAAMC
jgi:cyclopropane-fatty-acyl-phospholipid synthase